MDTRAPLFTVCAAALLAGCGRLELPKAKLIPHVQVDPSLQGELREFALLSVEFGRKIPSERANRLRVVKLVDDLPAQRRAMGAASVDPDTLAGMCVEVNERREIGVAGKDWREVVRFWREVWVDPTRADGTARAPVVVRALLFHELGHCLYGAEHVTGDEVALMSPTLPDDAAWIEAHWERLVSGFFLSLPSADTSPGP